MVRCLGVKIESVVATLDQNHWPKRTALLHQKKNAKVILFPGEELPQSQPVIHDPQKIASHRRLSLRAQQDHTFFIAL